MPNSNETLGSLHSVTETSPKCEAGVVSPGSTSTGTLPALAAILLDSLRDSERYVKEYSAGLGAE